MDFLTLPMIKSYLRLEADDTFEDDLLTLMADNAETYLKNSIENFESKLADAAFKKKAVLAGLVLVADFYENRILTTNKVSEKIRRVVKSLILQMKYSYGDPSESS